MGTLIPVDRPLDIAPDESVVAELDTLLLRGLMAWHIRFTLTNIRAQLRTTSRLEQLAGAKGTGFYVDEVEDLSWSRVTQQLTIKLRSRTLRLSGGEVWDVYQHLKSLVAPEETQARAMAALRTFLPGERLLYEGTVDVVVRDPLWATGEIQLTTERLRFKPGGGMQRLLLSGKPVEIRLADIEGMRITRGGTGLQLLWQIEPEDGEGTELEVALEVVRGGMSALAAAFLAMGAPSLSLGDAPPTDRVPLRPPVLLTAGRYGTGALGRTGTLAFGLGGFWFTSADFVASVAGTSAEGLSLADLNRVDLDPTRPRFATLVPRGDRPPLPIETDSTPLHATKLALLMASVPSTQGVVLDRQGRLDPKDVQNLARMNGAVLPEGRRPQGVAGAGVVRIGRDGRITRGWLLVLRSGLLFLSVGGHAEGRIFLDGPLIDRSRSAVDDDGILKVVAERREERFATCGGASTAQGLWQALWSHLPDTRSMAQRFPYLESIVGRVGYVRLSHRQRELLSRRMITTHLEREGLGFSVGPPIPEVLSTGMDIEVEMGNQEVVYEFRTHIARLDVQDGNARVVLGLSSKVSRRDNRRRAFRVAMDRPLSLHRRASHLADPEDDVIVAEMANLSWTGIAVMLDATHPDGTLFTTELALEDQTSVFTMEVIHSRKLPGDTRVLHGCRLLDLTAAHEDHLQSAVIRQQMREVYLREYGLSHSEIAAQEAKSTLET